MVRDRVETENGGRAALGVAAASATKVTFEATIFYPVREGCLGDCVIAASADLPEFNRKFFLFIWRYRF